MSPQTGSDVAAGYGMSIVEKEGCKYLRLVANFAGHGTEDVIVRPVENKLVIMDQSHAVLRSYDLPESVDPFTVDAEMTSGGVLTVTAAMQS